MMMILCEKCGKGFESADVPRRGPICFACHIKTVQIGFRYGREAFHGPTLGERQRKTVEDAKINGYDVSPVGSRWV